MVYYLQNLDLDDCATGDWDTFWEQADFMLEMVRCDFEKDLQSLEEALDDKAGQQRQRDHLIRFRKSDDPDQLAYFYDLGRRSLDIVEDLVAERAWTPALAHHWSVLMFAHGFIMPSAFAPRDDLDNDRRGLKGREATSREPQRRWYAHYLLREYRKPLRKHDVDDRIHRLVAALVHGNMSMPSGFDAAWFQALLDDGGHELSSRLQQMTRPMARSLVSENWEGLPPLDLPIP